ncbi:hypothetical protein C1646_749629 [Rhizophagus diaphanus]|nr:hypothetical protein C1646_749629 [Rhizophagus diaphanus] [Rhizophagus sp. MUCL 43196]
METVTNEALKAGGSWLANERQKFENFTEEKFQSFSVECQQESDWLRIYLQNIIQATKNVKILKKKEKPTVNNEISETSSYVELPTSSAQQTRKLVIKRTPRSKHEKPEIKSLVLAAAAAKREQEKQEKRAKEREVARRRAREKNIDLIGRKKANQIQDNGEKKPGILDLNIIEQPKQFVLPEVVSDDSSDEKKVKTKHQRRREDWEQSPVLKATLIRQASIDPETIFGKVPPLNMDGIFEGREHKFRPRSSSADWTGLDALTVDEELEYKVYMGFK